MNEWLNDFKETIGSASDRLKNISEAESAKPRAEDHWSSKQIIGHLIDSATNNHARLFLVSSKTISCSPAMIRMAGCGRIITRSARGWS